MSGTLRLALVGCGRQMRKNLIPFVQRLPNQRVVACVDMDLACAEQAQAMTGAAICVSSVDDLDLRNVDAAILALPPLESFELTSCLVEQGISCFVEKPAGPSTSALEKLADTVRRSACHVQIGFNFRYTEVLRSLHQLTNEGRSNPSAVTIDFYSRHPSAPQWGVDSTAEAWIRHNGVHPLDLARWFVPAPVTRLDAHTVPCGPDRLMVTVVMQHADQSLTTLRMGNRTKKFMVGVSVQTADGSRFTAPSLEQVTLDVDAGTPAGTILHRTSNLDHGWSRSGFGPELAAFLEAARQPARNASDEPSVADALAASELCDAVVDQLSREPGHFSSPTGMAAGADGNGWRTERHTLSTSAR